MSEPKTFVAVIDDDESFSRALTRLLRAAGLEPVAYLSVEAFLQDSAKPLLGCVVLDVHLGGMSGLHLQQHLKRLGGTTPIIFVTAHDEPEIRAAAEENGCAAYLRKPVPRKLLIEAITNAVQKR